jgi:hypothetical protein
MGIVVRKTKNEGIEKKGRRGKNKIKSLKISLPFALYIKI